MKFFLLAYKMCSFLGLVPLYNFEERKILYTKQKLVLPFFIIFYVVLVSGFFMLEMPVLMKEPFLHTRILDITDFLIFVQIPVVSVILTYFNLGTWGRYLKKILEINKELEGNQRNQERKMRLFIVIIFPSFQLAYIIVDIVHGQFSEKSSIYNCWYSITTDGEIHWLFMNVINNMTLDLFRRMYDILTNMLEKNINEAYENKFLCDEGKIIGKIKLIKKLNMDLFDAVGYFNVLYRWYMLSNLLFPLINALDLIESLLQEPTEFNYVEFISVEVRIFWSYPIKTV